MDDIEARAAEEKATPKKNLWDQKIHYYKKVDAPYNPEIKRWLRAELNRNVTPTHDRVVLIEYRDGSYYLSCKNVFYGSPGAKIMDSETSGELNSDGSTSEDFQGAFKATRRAFEEEKRSAKRKAKVADKIRSDVGRGVDYMTYGDDQLLEEYKAAVRATFETTTPGGEDDKKACETAEGLARELKRRLLEYGRFKMGDEIKTIAYPETFHVTHDGRIMGSALNDNNSTSPLDIDMLHTKCDFSFANDGRGAQ